VAPRQLITKRVKNIIAVSDLHCGCRLGLCPPSGVKLDDGGHYYPSEHQAAVWQWWEEFWEWVETTTHGEPFDLVVNGDALDGVHHRAVTQVSHNIEDQVKIARVALETPARRARKYYHIRGTEAHVGPSAQYEERLARDLGAIPNPQGQHARWELWKLLGDSGVLIHFSHHIGTTGSQAYESTGVLKELVEAYTEAGRWRKQPPDVIVRSHRHRNLTIMVPTKNQQGVSTVTPGWQLKTPFVWRLPGGRQSQPQFGGILIREAPDGVWYTTSWTRDLDRDEAEE
jgi:hypothetical protein